MSSSNTPTLHDERLAPEPSAASSNPAGDAEKQPNKPVMPDFPEGGLRGWLTLLGSWLIIFVTFGYANAFGAFQSYYVVGYPGHSASDISWIGSVQLFFQFSLGAVAGPLYDKGYFYHLLITGTTIYVVSIFMTSLAHEFWQTMLAQGIGLGIGIGLLFLPAVSVISQYFQRRRALAIGISVTGSSVGGICLPIMLNNLIESHGFKKAVQYTGYLLLGCLLIALALMRTRLPPKPSHQAKPTPKEIFSSKAYTIAVVGFFFVAWGLFFPIYYLQVYAEAKGISQNLTFYTLAILNAASVFGRISPNFLADSLGSLNLLTFMCCGAGIMVFAIFGAGTPGGLIVVAILYGFFSGAYVSLISPALISFATNFNEIGIRIGMGFLFTSFAALTGTPITGALLDKYGFYAPTVWSGVTVLAGAACFAVATVLQRRVKGTWKV